jgi:hypothetical protein
MTKHAYAEVKFDALPNDVANALISMMWASRFKVENSRFIEQPLTIYINGTHSMSFRSWGERIKITIMTCDGGSKVNAESKSTVELTLFDYGQNKENLEILMNLLILKFRSTSPLVIKEARF